MRLIASWQFAHFPIRLTHVALGARCAQWFGSAHTAHALHHFLLAQSPLNATEPQQ
ncbi:Uncharacterised protein [Vibrio cholerae]|uniref:Uncharacterized protein n=1 Tax=Vibrio cholerae TaxID=666 RepID=A0A656AMT7_VIBCL|nr:Uncharacterised protein [Vibrio cholerae]